MPPAIDYFKEGQANVWLLWIVKSGFSSYYLLLNGILWSEEPDIHASFGLTVPNTGAGSVPAAYQAQAVESPGGLVCVGGRVRLRLCAVLPQVDPETGTRLSLGVCLP